MPKRKHEDDYEYIKKKLRYLEGKLRDSNTERRRSVSSDSSTRSSASPAAERTPSETREIEFINNLLNPPNCDQMSDEPPPEQEPGPSKPQSEMLVENTETIAKTPATDPSLPAGPAPSAPAPVASAPSTPTPAAPTPAPVASAPSTPAPAAPTPAPVASAPSTPAPAAPAPAASAPVASAPSTAAPAAPAPAASAPVASSPSALTQAATAPTASAPVASSPPTSTPVAPAPAASAPVASSPSTSTPAAPAPAASAPIASSPSTPTSAAPLVSAPSTPTPAAPAPAAELPPPDSACGTPGTDEIGLDAHLLELLGTDPSTIKKYGKEIQKDLFLKLEQCATTGLSKELRKELKERYLTPDNCKFMDPPELNAELKAVVSEKVSKRDKAIEGKQNQLSSAISCLAEAITLLMSLKEKNSTLLNLLIDGARIMCDCQHSESITRRNFILNAVKKDMKDQLQNTIIGKFLFSESLADTQKSPKVIPKSGSDVKIPAPKAPTKKAVPGPSNPPRNSNSGSHLKIPAPKAPPKKAVPRPPNPPRNFKSESNLKIPGPKASPKKAVPGPHNPPRNFKSESNLKIPGPKAPTKKAEPGPPNPPRNLNWKNPGVVRTQSGPPWIKEPATTSKRSRPGPPGTSWKLSQQPQQRSHSRR